MEKIEEKSAQYVAENLNEILKEAFARVYEDGYRDGYYAAKDEEEVEVSNTEFVDLGLPSGTLWSSDFLRNGADIAYMPFLQAKELNIPTEEQWNELQKNCIIKICKNENDNTIYGECIGPNGKSIQFCMTEFKTSANVDTPSTLNQSFFWINKICEKDNFVKCIKLYTHKRELYLMQKESIDIFMGYHLPVRLVKSKK